MGVQEKLEVARATDRFDLIETMRFEALDGFVELERHLGRMNASARELGFAFNRHDCRNDLQAATFRLTHDARIRLMLARSGAVAPASPFDPNTGLPNQRPYKILTVTYTINGLTKTKQALEGQTVVLD